MMQYKSENKTLETRVSLAYAALYTTAAYTQIPRRDGLTVFLQFRVSEDTSLFKVFGPK